MEESKQSIICRHIWSRFRVTLLASKALNTSRPKSRAYWGFFGFTFEDNPKILAGRHHFNYIRSHDSIWLHVAWHNRTLAKQETKTKYHIIKWHDTKWHHITSHVANNHINSPQVTSQPTTLLHLNHATDLMTSKHITSKHMTSQPWNSRRLVHTKKLVWASRWSVALRTFYRQILSLLYTSFFFWNFRPRGEPGAEVSEEKRSI